MPPVNGPVPDATRPQPVVVDNRPRSQVNPANWHGVVFIFAILGGLIGLLVGLTASIHANDHSLQWLVTTVLVVCSTLIGFFVVGLVADLIVNRDRGTRPPAHS